MERLELDDAAVALKEIKANDAAHERTMRQLFRVHWEDPLLYDVVLNTERISIPECVEQVQHLVNQPSFRETAESRTKLDDLKRATSARAYRSREPRPLEVDFPADYERRIRHARAQYDEVPKTREECDLLL